jgi:hypothetical protein
MQEVRDRVRLVDASEIGARGIQATVPRAEIRDVLSSKDGEPELVIDVTRAGEAEAHTLRLAWDPGELEELLRKADGDNVTLAFNGSELEQALEDDVAAHGLREAAVVLAVAATTAAAGAGVAQAAQVTAAAPGTTSAVVSEREWPQAVQQSTGASPGQVSEREWPQAVGGTAAESSAPASASQGVVSEREWPQAVQQSTGASPGQVSEREWPQAVSGAAAQSAAPAPTSTSAVSDAATAGAVAGGAALLIAAAGFTVRRHRKVEPRPV